MQTFYKTLKNTIKHSNHPLDEKLLIDISSNFKEIALKWRDKTFEPRESQLLFSYLLCNNALSSNKPIALSLGCGEGKQEGFGVALKTLYNKEQSKLLFLSANEDLLMQMKNSTPLKDLQHIHIVDENTPSDFCKKPAIYLMSFKTYLFWMLRQKTGYTHSVLKDVKKVFVDEFHAFINSAPYIISNTAINHHNQKGVISKLLSYKELLQMLQELHKEQPQIIAQSTKRSVASFNPHNIKKANIPLQQWLYDKITTQKPYILEVLEIQNYHTFCQLLDTMANAISKEVAKDYYIYKTKDNLKAYECADNNAKPMAGTVFADKLLSLFVALKHSSNFTKDDKKSELDFLLGIYHKKNITKITPIESIKQMDSNKFAVASATMKGVSLYLKELGFDTLFLQAEPKLLLNDTDVTVDIDQKDPLTNLKTSLSYTRLTNVVLITSKNANLLKQIQNDATIKQHFKSYDAVSVYLSAQNPQTKLYEEQLQKLKQDIYLHPHKKRVLFIQGIAEGTNIFQTTPHGSYEATIFKLDLSAIDTTTQTRYRVGVKGRADGKFIHTVSTSLSTADMLTIDEINQLQNTSNKKQLLIEIEKKILQESQQNNVAYEFVANRRDFIANIFKLSTASLMINPFADMLNKTFNKKILHTNDLKADENIEYPPGIINCRDPAIKTAYRLSCMNQGHYVYKYDKEIGAILAGVLALKSSNVPAYGRIKSDTPFKEPAYWYICAKIDDYPHGKYKNNILKKENEPIYHFKNGIIEYFSYWIRNHENYFKYIEKSFLSAIFTAAGKDANEYKTFLAKNIDERKQYLQDIMKIFEDMEFDKNKNQINDNYDKALIASWSSYWLVTHYLNIEGKSERTMLIFNEVEQKFKKTGKNNEDLRVRGPPIYQY